MKKKKDDFKEMFEELTDPRKLAEVVRKGQIKKMLEDKRKDAGL